MSISIQTWSFFISPASIELVTEKQKLNLNLKIKFECKDLQSILDAKADRSFQLQEYKLVEHMDIAMDLVVVYLELDLSLLCNSCRLH